MVARVQSVREWSLRQTIIQAIEPEAEQLVARAGGRVLSYATGYVYEAAWAELFPSIRVVWPPQTKGVYLTPTGQDDQYVLFLVVFLPRCEEELHLTYAYRLVLLWESWEEWCTLRKARENLLPSRRTTDL